MVEKAFTSPSIYVMKNTTVVSFFRIMLVLGTMLAHLYPLPTAATEIKAHYTRAEGKTITLNLAIASPPPNSIIVIQNLPPGSLLIRSTPPHKSYKKKPGKIKWLIKNPAAGNMNIQLQLKNPVPAGAVSAMVRYLDANTGTFKTEVVP